MVALYNGVGGGAVALIAWSEFRHGLSIGSDFPLEEFVPILFAAVIGSVSFWGSNIAFGKLQDLIPTGSVALPGQQVINGAAARGRARRSASILGIDHADDPSQLLFILILIGAALLGDLAVLPIGGADMPVVISLLNAATGLSAAAAGFSLDNVALIVAGTLVGSSGTILTMEMATAMNRSVSNVLFAGFGGGAAAARRRAGRGAAAPLDRRPGRGDLARLRRLGRDRPRLRARRRAGPARGQGAGQRAREARASRSATRSIPSPAACPGHMNVLLAEADVPYEKLVEMEDINPDMPRTDVAVVIGANDVTNPAAKNDPDSPIAGMPIIEVAEAQQVIVIKRSLSPGFAGIDNDLFYMDKTALLFDDAKKAAQEIAAEVTNSELGPRSARGLRLDADLTPGNGTISRRESRKRPRRWTRRAAGSAGASTTSTGS